MNPALRNIILAPQGIVRRGLVAWYDFTDPVGSQVLTDRSGLGNHGQNGTTAGIDTNDVTFDGGKATFGGDDFIDCQIPLINSAAYTIITLAQVNNLSKMFEMFFSQYTANTAGRLYLGMEVSTNKFRFFHDSGYVSSDVAVTNKATYIAAVRHESGLLNMFIGPVLQSNSVASSNPPLQTKAMIGGVPAYTLSDTNVFSTLLYSRDLTPLEVKQNYTALKKLMAQRGIAI